MAKKTEKQIAESNDAISGYLKYMQDNHHIENGSINVNSRTHCHVTYELRGNIMKDELEISIGEGHYQGKVEIYGCVKISEDTVDHLKFNASSNTFKFDGTNLKIWGRSKTGNYKVTLGEYSDIVRKTW